MNILVTNNTLTVKLCEDIDHKNALDIRKQIDSEIGKRPIKTLIFDFSGVEFMDSAGIGMILGRYKLLNAIGGMVYINNPTKAVLKIIEISGINKIIPIMYNNESCTCEVK
ncbi:MAG: anti-sigma factor antagonist [Clostridia bacterium]|nr:anti-sigma factor antagonist [Clostridia bacterium]